MVHTLTATAVTESTALPETKFSSSLVSGERQRILHRTDILRPRNLLVTDPLYHLSSAVKLFNLHDHMQLSHQNIQKSYITRVHILISSTTVTCETYIRSVKCLLIQRREGILVSHNTTVYTC